MGQAKICLRLIYWAMKERAHLIRIHSNALEFATDRSWELITRSFRSCGVPYGSRTRVAAVKEKRPLVIQRNFAAWIALYRT